MYLILRDPTSFTHALRAVLIAAAIMIGTCAAGAQTTTPRCEVGSLKPYPDSSSWAPEKWYLDQLIRVRDTVTCLDGARVMTGRLVTGIVNPFDRILRNMDSLGLSPRQADSLASLNRMYSRARFELGMSVSNQVVNLPVTYQIETVWTGVLPMYEDFVTRWGAWGLAAKGILNLQQLAALPREVAGHLEPTCIRQSLLGVSAGKTEIERATEIANRRRRTGCPW